MMYYFRNFPLLALALLLFSCEKKYVEIVPVADKVEDRSIPGGGNIKFFTFPSAAVGYAASDTNFIYKTEDSGKTWNKIEMNTGRIKPNSKCLALEFIDEMNGFCVMNDNISDNTLMATSNGGKTWSIAWGANIPFAGISDEGKAYICEFEWSRRTVQIKESTDKGKTFNNLIKLYTEVDFNQLKVVGTSIYILTVEGTVHGYNPAKTDTTRVYIGLPPGRRSIYDFVFNDHIKVAACADGILKQNSAYNFNGLYEAYNDHDYNYYSVDAYEDLAIAVGQRTIATNMPTMDEEKWHELLNSNGNSFKETFYKIKFIDRNYFYVSGAKGLIWKMKI